jgi:hypothetical protein
MRGKAGDTNFIDPNTVRVDDRDRFPKVNLYDQYLGDGFPLCSDLPSRGFLRAGARYRRTFTFDETTSAWFAVTNAPSIVLGSGSRLARALCGRPGGAPLFGVGVNSSGCMFEDEVTLSDDLSCDGDECLVWNDALTIVSTKVREVAVYSCINAVSPVYLL